MQLATREAVPASWGPRPAERPGSGSAGRERGVRPSHSQRVSGMRTPLPAAAGQLAARGSGLTLAPVAPAHARWPAKLCEEGRRPWALPAAANGGCSLTHSLHVQICYPQPLTPPCSYDSDHPRVSGDVGMAGVAVDSVEDMKARRGAACARTARAARAARACCRSRRLPPRGARYRGARPGATCVLGCRRPPSPLSPTRTHTQFSGPPRPSPPASLPRPRSCCLTAFPWTACQSP